MGRMSILVRWQPPPMGHIKVNIDGSWASKAAGAGGNFRDYLGICRGYFASPIVASSPLEAECWAFLLALKVAISFNFLKLIVETNSINLFKEFDIITIPKWIVVGIWNRIRAIIEKYNFSIHLAHVFREGNSPADWLAEKDKIEERILIGVLPESQLK
ncbi:uncharacterized protein LOC110036712 [Phalaenopsis equestris]|uniref:uncharacterized protein LOC110036712 n=1 Tax=Phalaenopsis equestris TaxID=78828 RepID=UPI0009E2D968|nr:uncharacterized protein LOC110036712 [Phalaenopsis equestris]